jgi:hypothetical protein
MDAGSCKPVLKLNEVAPKLKISFNDMVLKAD